MAELLEQMGIQKGSFYATFGSKHDVLMDALKSYVKDRFAEFDALHRNPSPRAALEQHLREVAAGAPTPEGRRGCFVVNAAIELAPRDEEVKGVAQRVMREHEEHYFRLLEAARQKGEVAADLDPRQTARGLLAMVLGIRVLSRASSPRSVIEGVRDGALALLGGHPKKS